MGDHDQKPVIQRVDRGASASSTVAVGIVAAWRGDEIKSDVALTGKIIEDGRIEAAARAQFKTLLIPRGQLYSPDGDLSLRQRNGT